MVKKIFEDGFLKYHEILFEYQSKLDLTSDELVVLIQLANLAQKRRFNLSTLSIARMTSFKTNVVGDIVNSLFEKDIISIQFERKTAKEKISEVFDLSPLFDKITQFLKEDLLKEQETKSVTDVEYVIRVLEKIFDKPLTPRYLEMVKQWFTDGYSKEEIDQAIETTQKHGRKSVNYVDKILRNEIYDQESKIDEKTADFLRKLVGK